MGMQLRDYLVHVASANKDTRGQVVDTVTRAVPSFDRVRQAVKGEHDEYAP
jgi:hypothetical protein